MLKKFPEKDGFLKLKKRQDMNYITWPSFLGRSCRYVYFQPEEKTAVGRQRQEFDCTV